MSIFGYVGYKIDGNFNGGVEKTPNLEYLSLSQKISIKGNVCDQRLIEGFEWIKKCDFGDLTATRSVVLIGDSHSQAISYSLESSLRENKIRGIYLSLGGCETVPYIHRDKLKLGNQCDIRFGEFIDYLSSLNSDVILSSRWSFKLYPIDGVIEDMPYVNSEGHTEKNSSYREYDALRDGLLSRSAEDKAWALSTYVDKIASASQRLFLVYPVPETGINIEKYNRLYYKINGKILNSLSMSMEDYDNRNSFVIGVFEQLSSVKNNIIKIKPRDIFCNSIIKHRCVIQHNSVPFYYDDDHLSKDGADLILRSIKQITGWK